MTHDPDVQRFGIRPHDEGMHPYPPDTPEWQESVFYDFIDEGGTLAGHCRLGLHPAHQTMWLWLFVTDGEGWLAIEQPQLPYRTFDTDHWSFTHEGLSFERQVSSPLHDNTLRVSGPATRISGARAGASESVDLALTFTAAGPAYSMGEREETGPDGAAYEAKRFEQPMAVRGSIQLGDRRYDFQGRGERDHSWGSRYWDFMDWTFMTLHGAALRAQCTEVCFGGSRFTLGYVQRDEMVAIHEATFDLSLRPDLDDPCSGTVQVPVPGGETLSGRVVAVGVVPIQISHVYAMPLEAMYRRALIRWEPDDGSAPCMGWLEWCVRLSEPADA